MRKNAVVFLPAVLAVFLLPVHIYGIELLWKRPAGGLVTGGPAGRGGNIYFYSEDRHLHALTVSGERLWRSRMAGGGVCGVTEGPDGTVYALFPAECFML